MTLKHRPSAIEIRMKVKYFSDTDTAHIEFTDSDVHETKEISENIYVDIDENGNLVNIPGNVPLNRLNL